MSIVITGILFQLALGTPTVAPNAAAWHELERIVQEGLEQNLYPGGVVVIGRRDSVLYAHGFGRLAWKEKVGSPDPDSTLFDIASLTKVVATTGVVARLADQGRIDLDAPVSKYLPKFSGGKKRRVTVRHLLDHTSGLPSFVPFYKRAKTRKAVIAALMKVPLRSEPGVEVVYSDLNAILLGLVIESITGSRLDVAARKMVFQPLRMSSATFSPRDNSRVAPSFVAKGGPVAGLVSDPNARAMGGVAGHAGLFASAMDLAIYAQAWLGGRDWLSKSMVSQFLERDTVGRRVLGWDVPVTDDTLTSAFGALATSSMFGHTGWTGTFLWFDPNRDLFLVFLTNRSLGPTTGKRLKAMREIRARLSDQLARMNL